MSRNRRSDVRWTEEMIQFLSSNYTLMNYDDLAAVMSEKFCVVMDHNYISRKLGQLGLKKGCKGKSYWTDKMVRFLVDNYGSMLHKDLASIMSERYGVPMNEESIGHKLRKLGLTQNNSSIWTDEMREFLANNYAKMKYEDLAIEMSEKFNLSITVWGISYQLRQMRLKKDPNIFKKGHKGKTYWTDEMIQFLIDNFEYMTYEELATTMSKKFNVQMTENSINNKVTRLNLRRKVRWTDDMDKYLLDNYQNMFYSQLAEDMSDKFGIKLSMDSVFGRIRNLREKEGRTQIPKKPPVATNTKPIGTEIVNSGYIWIKLSDIPVNDSTKNWRENWVTKHRYIWEQANGSIPEDHCIIFLDGNKQNCELSNLRCVPRSYVVRMVSGLANDIFKEGPEMIGAGIAWCELNDAIKEIKEEKKNGN